MTCTYTAACKTTYWQKRFFTSTESHSKGNPNTLIKLHTQYIYNAQQVGKYKSRPYNVSIGNQKEEDINRDMSSSQDRGRRNPAPKTMEKRRIKERQSARVNTDTEQWWVEWRKRPEWRSWHGDEAHMQASSGPERLGWKKTCTNPPLMMTLHWNNGCRNQQSFITFSKKEKELSKLSLEWVLWFSRCKCSCLSLAHTSRHKVAILSTFKAEVCDCFFS